MICNRNSSFQDKSNGVRVLLYSDFALCEVVLTWQFFSYYSAIILSRRPVPQMTYGVLSGLVSSRLIAAMFRYRLGAADMFNGRYTTSADKPISFVWLQWRPAVRQEQSAATNLRPSFTSSLQAAQDGCNWSWLICTREYVVRRVGGFG